MKANAPKRKIFDAVDMMTADAEVTVKDGVQMLPIDSIRTFHDHPFRLYEGAWLNEMVESIKECGVLNPVIVRKAGKGYEMLSGHNRQNAARIAGLTEIPAIVKEGLSDEEAYVYVIETNLIQRSFADLLPSERAAVLEARYNKVCCQGKRNDIIRELQVMSGETPEETCGHNGHKLKSRDALAEEYGYSSRNVARYLRINNLIGPIKDLLDTNRIAFLAAVDMSYLADEEQESVYKVIDEKGMKLKQLIGDMTEKKPASGHWVNVKLPDDVFRKRFAGLSMAQITEVVEQALEEWFAKEDADV